MIAPQETNRNGNCPLNLDSMIDSTLNVGRGQRQGRVSTWGAVPNGACLWVSFYIAEAFKFTVMLCRYKMAESIKIGDPF